MMTIKSLRRRLQFRMDEKYRRSSEGVLQTRREGNSKRSFQTRNNLYLSNHKTICIGIERNSHGSRETHSNTLKEVSQAMAKTQKAVVEKVDTLNTKQSRTANASNISVQLANTVCKEVLNLLNTIAALRSKAVEKAAGSYSGTLVCLDQVVTVLGLGLGA